MALVQVESVGPGIGYVPIMLGQTQTVSNQEAANEMTSRGFQRGAAPTPPISPPTPPKVVPTIGRSAAISKAVDESLVYYQKGKSCDRRRNPGGCFIDERTFDRIASRSALLATRYLRAGAVTPRTPTVTPVSPAISPAAVRYPPPASVRNQMTASETRLWNSSTYQASSSRRSTLLRSITTRLAKVVRPTTRVTPASPPVSPAVLTNVQVINRFTSSERTAYMRLSTTARRLAFIANVRRRLLAGIEVAEVSPRLRGILGDLYQLGQAPIEEPEMTRWDWVGIIANAASGVASNVEAYAKARAQREAAGQTAQLTAREVASMVDQVLAQYPGLRKKDVQAAAAGAGGEAEPAGMPSWLVPAVVGIGAVAIVMAVKR